jgi:hypothetical protein
MPGRRCGCSGLGHGCESCRQTGSSFDAAHVASLAPAAHLGHSFASVRVHADARWGGAPSAGRATAVLAPSLLDGDAPKRAPKCEEFPGGSTDCEVDEKTGTPTGKVTHHIDETNPCTRPCVEQHELVHVEQLKTFCPQLRDCYRDADRGKRPATECVAMAIFGTRQRECEAYKVSVPCMEKRLQGAKECQPKAAREYGVRKLASEKCFRDQACAESDVKKTPERSTPRKKRP